MGDKHATTEPQTTSWLGADDMLPQIAPNARIMRYGYRSQWFAEIKESTVRLNVAHIAMRLLLSLDRARKVG